MALYKFRIIIKLCGKITVLHVLNLIVVTLLVLSVDTVDKVNDRKDMCFYLHCSFTYRLAVSKCRTDGTATAEQIGSLVYYVGYLQSKSALDANATRQFDENRG